MKLFHRIRSRSSSVCTYLFVLAAFVLGVSPNLLSEGMFMDGLIYSSIAHNLSLGIGSFWHLSFSETVMRDFYGHPPLAIYLQSWIYTLLGNAYWVDKLYSFSLILLQAVFIHLVWKEMWRLIHPFAQKSSIWALGFFLLSPLVVWASTNNLLENTLVIFVLFAIWCYLHFQRMFQPQRYIYLVLAGIALALGFLCKSFVGLFVWGLPLAWWLSGCFKYNTVKTSHSLIDCLRETTLLIFFSLLPLLCLYLQFDQIQNYAHHYWLEQIVGSFHTQGVLSRWYLPERFMWEALPILIVFVAVLWWNRKDKLGQPSVSASPERQRVSMLFLLLFVFGTVPLCVSLKQRTFYLLTAWPLFSMGLAVWMPGIKPEKQLRKFPLALLSLVVAIAMCFFFAERPVRQTKLLKDVHVIVRIVPPSSILQISPSMTQEWSLYGYMSRYAQISLEHRYDRRCHFLLINKKNRELRDESLLKDYEPMSVPLEGYKLYRLKEINKTSIGF